MIQLDALDVPVALEVLDLDVVQQLHGVSRDVAGIEGNLIQRALAASGGRRIEAAQLLGIGRNTITRKIQELGLDDAKGTEEQG